MQGKNSECDMIKKVIWVIALLFCVSAGYGAPFKAGDKLGLRDYLGGSGRSNIGLLDPSKVSISHNVQFGFSTGGDQSVAQGLYATNIGYRLSNPVTLNVMLGAQRTNYMGNSPLSGNIDSFFGGVSLDYQPSRNFRMNFSVIQAPYSQLYYSNRYMNLSPFADYSPFRIQEPVHVSE